MKIIKKDAALNAQPLVSNVNVCTCEIGYKRSFLLVVVVTYWLFNLLVNQNKVKLSFAAKKLPLEKGLAD